MQVLYSTLANHYDEIIAEHTNTEEELTFLTDALTRFEARTIIDIACGSGRHTIALADKGFLVTGVDYSEKLLRLGQSKAKHQPNARFVHQDVAELELGQVFDAAICMWSTFGELPYRELLIRLSDHLHIGSIFVIDMTHYDRYDNPPRELISEASTATGEPVKIIITKNMKTNSDFET